MQTSALLLALAPAWALAVALWGPQRRIVAMILPTSMPQPQPQATPESPEIKIEPPQSPSSEIQIVTPEHERQHFLNISRPTSSPSPVSTMVDLGMPDPTQYLYFDIDPNLKGIQIRGLDGQNNQGEHTISICNLNRPDLKLKRLRILENYISLINSAFEMLRKGIIKDNQFVESLFIHFDQFFENTTDIELEHTFLVKYVISNYDKFEIIILPLLLEKQRAIVSTAFKMYLNQRNIV